VHFSLFTRFQCVVFSLTGSSGGFFSGLYFRDSTVTSRSGQLDTIQYLERNNNTRTSWSTVKYVETIQSNSGFGSQVWVVEHGHIKTVHTKQMDIYISIYINTYACICIYIYIYACTYLYIMYVCVCMYVCMYICMHVCVCIYVGACLCMYLCVYVCVYTYVHTLNICMCVRIMYFCLCMYV
jgi:hypothetical protein